MTEMNLFQELNRRLSEVSEDAYNLEEVHGYLTAVIVGPEVIPPSEWLPGVFNYEHEMPDFNDEKEAEIIGVLLEFYNHIITTLDNEEFTPMVAEFEQGKKLIADPGPWCTAFMHGISLRSEKWEEDESHELTILIYPILHFIEDEKAQKIAKSIFKNDLPSVDKDFFNLLPHTVFNLRDYWRQDHYESGDVEDGDLFENLVPFRRQDPKVGRNAPCPCGSGKKYKKCCGPVRLQ